MALARTKELLKSLFGLYLPLSGGTMTGHLYFGSNTSIGQNNDTSFLDIYGGIQHDSGAQVTVFGKDQATNPGQFVLQANDGSSHCDLSGTPGGSLTWSGKNVERVNSSGSNFIRYENGLQICFASSYYSSASNQITYPVAFGSMPTVAVGNGAWNAEDWGSTGFTLNHLNSSTGGYSSWIAIGFWK